MNNSIVQKSGYSEVNGLSMYYEMYGQGKPFVLLHGGGSTIQTSFGNIIPHLTKQRQIIAVELQAHGRTNDRNTDLTFKQDADDVATLLNNLDIAQADFLGFSNGGHTAIEIAIHYPNIVDRLILCSAFYKRSAAAPQFWAGFNQVNFSDMPQALKDGYLLVNNNADGLMNMFYKDVQRMKVFKDWSDEQIKSIQSPTLIINSSVDVGSSEHAIEMHRTIPNSDLAILPGKHGAYLGAIEYLEDGKWNQTYSVDILEEFLNNKPASY